MSSIGCTQEASNFIEPMTMLILLLIFRILVIFQILFVYFIELKLIYCKQILQMVSLFIICHFGCDWSLGNGYFPCSLIFDPFRNWKNSILVTWITDMLLLTSQLLVCHIRTNCHKTTSYLVMWILNFRKRNDGIWT